MNATTYTGNGSSSGQAITNGVPGQNFTPDMVWIKARNNGYNQYLVDTVRGFSGSAARVIQTNLTTAEETDAANSGGAFKSFNSNGFTVAQPASGWAGTNENNTTYVGWQWKAGGTAVTNTAGTTTTQVSANQTAGFSIVTYTGTGSNMTIGHGLGQAPKLWFWKNRSATSNWSLNYYFLYNSMRFMLLNATDAQGNNSGGYWGNPPTSTVNYVGAADPATNISGQQFVMYAFAEVPGFSSIGSYTGNGSADGTFIYTGFRPRFVLIKRTNTADSWYIHDTSRSPYNASAARLLPNSSAAEISDQSIDFVSNGFKMRIADGAINGSGSTYIYMAFAENPFKYANAR
jgi:hypothetical protein